MTTSVATEADAIADNGIHADPENTAAAGESTEQPTPGAEVGQSAPSQTGAKPKPQKSQQPRRQQNPMYLMLPMPKDKKTNSRPGIRRRMALNTRLSQEMFFRAYEKVSNANYFLERIYPGMISGRAGNGAAVVRQGFEDITQLWKGLYEEAKKSFEGIIESISARLESEGVDAQNIQLDFSEVIEEDALVTSRMDQHYLNLLQLLDKTLGFIAAASLYDVYESEESAKLEREVRQRILGVYRYNLRYAFETGLLLRTGKTAEMRHADNEKAKAEKQAADHDHGGTTSDVAADPDTDHTETAE